MTRVMLVGAEPGPEGTLLQRLRHLGARLDGPLVACNSLDSCDLLVIGDLPALRRQAIRLVAQRPELQLWVQCADGVLRGLGHDALPHAHAHNTASDTPPTADVSPAPGAKSFTRQLRAALQQQQGIARIDHSDGRPWMWLDCSRAQLIHATKPPPDAIDLGRQLGQQLGHLGLAWESRLPDALEHAPRLPLFPVLWQAALASSCWQDLDLRLLQGERVSLIRWPDFRVLGRQHDGFRLCSLLLKQPCSVEEASRLLGLDSVQVTAFVHTAYLCGYARLVQTQSTPVSAAIGDQQGSLLGRMWRRLREQVV